MTLLLESKSVSLMFEHPVRSSAHIHKACGRYIGSSSHTQSVECGTRRPATVHFLSGYVGGYCDWEPATTSRTSLQYSRQDHSSLSFYWRPFRHACCRLARQPIKAHHHLLPINANPYHSSTIGVYFIAIARHVIYKSTTEYITLMTREAFLLSNHQAS